MNKIVVDTSLFVSSAVVAGAAAFGFQRIAEQPLDQQTLPTLIVKVFVLWVVVWLGLKSISTAKIGKEIAKSAKDAILQNPILKADHPILTLHGYEPTDGEKTESIDDVLNKLRDSLKKDVEVGKALGLRIIAAVCQSFHIGHSALAAESTLSNRRSSVEEELAVYFEPAEHAESSLPLIGFAGTIVGIMFAMGGLSDVFSKAANNPAVIADEMPKVVKSLSVAFDTTFAALLMTLFVKFRQASLAKQTERSINDAILAMEDHVIPKLRVPVLTQRLEETLKEVFEREERTLRQMAVKREEELLDAQQKALQGRRDALQDILRDENEAPDDNSND